MSFFLFKSKKGKLPIDEEPSVRGVPESQPCLDNSFSQQAEDENDANLLPSGASLINPNLQPEKARNFADIRLPQSFVVRFLGTHPASGIWGIKHTRKAFDVLVELAKSTDADDLSMLELDISESGVSLRQISPSRPNDTSKEIDLGKKPIERISYGNS